MADYAPLIRPTGFALELDAGFKDGVYEPTPEELAGIDRGPRGADCGPKLVGNRLDIFGEILSALHRPPPRNDDLGRREFRALGFRQLLPNKGGDAGVRPAGQFLDLSILRRQGVKAWI